MAGFAVGAIQLDPRPSVLRSRQLTYAALILGMGEAPISAGRISPTRCERGAGNYRQKGGKRARTGAPQPVGCAADGSPRTSPADHHRADAPAPVEDARARSGASATREAGRAAPTSGAREAAGVKLPELRAATGPPQGLTPGSHLLSATWPSAHGSLSSPPTAGDTTGEDTR